MHSVTTTGVNGLDSVLYGGFPKGSTIIMEGAPGTGKTTFGVQFLVEGIKQAQEPGIYITFEEFPQQIYQDMLAFGWDLRELEKQNLLRVISIKPDVLYNQLMTPGGLIEQIIAEIGCRRIVVDSITLFEYMHAEPAKAREALYSLRNMLRRLSLTSLLLSEQSGSEQRRISFEHYVVDGVIHLSLEQQMNNFRKRTLEITKMRGRKIVEGEHIYRITDHGIHLVPAMSMVEDLGIRTRDSISTGIERLDELLSGGIPQGSAFIVDTNSKANYKFLTGSIIAQQFLRGSRVLVLPSSLSSAAETAQVQRLFGVDFDEVVKQKRILIVDHYQRPIPAGMEGLVYNVRDIGNKEYLSFLSAKIGPIVEEGIRQGEDWFVYYDLNTVFSLRGAEFVKRFFTEEIARARAGGISVLALCNFTEIGLETASYLERTSTGTIRTWVDGSYQYLQVTKSPSGRVSEPHLVETIAEKPFIRLV